MTEVEATGIVLGLISSVAAVIAAIPIIQGWRSPSMSDSEKAVLRIALSNAEYPGIIQYWVHALADRNGPHVSAPYMQNHINVTDEILRLRDINLISAMDRMPNQHEACIWYQLTAKGYRVAKGLSAHDEKH